MRLDESGHAGSPEPSSSIHAVDCHAHVMQLDAPLAPARHSAPLRNVPVGEFIALLDRHGLSHGVLTQPSFYGADNSILLEALAQHPDRLRGTAIVEEDVSEAALAALREANIVGVRLNWIRRQPLPDIASASFRKFLARVAAAGLHVEIYLEGPLLAHVLPQLRASRARIVVDHFGAPDPHRRLACPGFRAVLDGVSAGDTWVKLSAPYRLGGADPRPYVDALLVGGGARQLLWASDWPWISHENGQDYQACLDALARWVPDEAQRRNILADSPREVMGLTS